MAHSIVLVKQVPDTANITGEVMKPDGTVNRAKLPAVLNTEDRVALELALRIRDRYGGKVTTVTMGPPRAADVLRECLYLGADAVYLLCDQRFAGADTLATSYVLSRAVARLAPYDLVLAGRQAIDGDTAQVGPQTAEKLGLPQITCATRIIEFGDDAVTVRHRVEGGCEVLRSPLPVLITVAREAAEPRPPSAKRVLAYKRARTREQLERDARNLSPADPEHLVRHWQSRGLLIPTLTADDLDVTLERCGSAGSPTKVHRIRSVVLSRTQRETIEPTPEGLRRLIETLREDRILL
jgi:electron transfer flavoprotein beta subunit